MSVMRCAAVALCGVLLAGSAAAQDAAALADQIKGSANPELIGMLTKELGGSVEQASGVAGSLLGLAKTRLKPEEFTKVSNAIPGIDSLLSAAPAMTGATGTAGAAAAATGTTGTAGANTMGGLASLAPAFEKLGLTPSAAAKAVPILTTYVSKTGGADVGSLLAGALK